MRASKAVLRGRLGRARITVERAHVWSGWLGETGGCSYLIEAPGWRMGTLWLPTWTAMDAWDAAVRRLREQ